eukprot:snap_masked-scaffold201_size263271-processed-gene-1.3 protein:Tk08044 transcript:snap_masked-scaffold201_size263271-processed-gene-1.3-mRNA-1 annotation:"hypothetical protein DAPPUDRAFT_331010"
MLLVLGALVALFSGVPVEGETSIIGKFGSNGIGGSISYPGSNYSPNYPQVTEPPIASNVVAFTATRASRYSLDTNAKVRFERTITDIGYGWDANSGEFKTYFPGVYVFTWSGVSPKFTNFRLTLMKNGYEVGQTWGEQTGYQSGSNTIILSLNSGDRVYLQVSEGHLYEPDSSDRGYTTFSGYKL